MIFSGPAGAQTPGELPAIIGRGPAGTGKPLIAFVAAATTQVAGNGATVNATVPSTQSGDILVALVFSGYIVTASPAGWTRVVNASDQTFAETDIYYHVSTGATEPATYAWTGGGPAVQIRDYRFMNSSPFDSGGGSVNFFVLTANCQIPSMANTGVDNELYVGFWANSNTVITTPPGLSNIVIDNNPSNDYVVGADQIIGPAGSAVSPKNATFTQTFNGCAGATFKPQ